MNWESANRFVAFAVLIQASAFVPAAPAAVFTPGSVVCGGPNGHCYQVVSVGPDCSSFSYLEARNFAASGKIGTLYGHLLTIESQAEWDWLGGNNLRNDQPLGAQGLSNGPYAWSEGPSAGATVQFFTSFFPAPRAGCTSGYGPWPRLGLGLGGYVSLADVLWTRVCGNPGVGCGGTPRFVIEHEEDAVPPVATQILPNGGEQYFSGDPVTLSWNASDPFGRLATIDIELSRSGPGGPFESIATGLSSAAGPSSGQAQLDGTFQWIVTGPATNDAYIRVVAHDEAGNTATDLSDQPFSIDAPTNASHGSWGKLKVRYR